MAPDIDEAVKIYKTLAKIPDLVGAQLVHNGAAINTFWSQRNVEYGKTTKFMRTFLLNEKLEPVTSTASMDVSSELISSTSGSEKFRAVVRTMEEKGGRNQYMEIWSREQLYSTVNLTASAAHGNIYTDAEFGPLQWSRDERQVWYIAEEKPRKTAPFYKRESAKNTDDSDPAARGQEYAFQQDWGEQMVGLKQSVIAHYCLDADRVEVTAHDLPPNYCPAQIKWSLDGSYIVGVAYNTAPRKLGLVFCNNRPSSLFKYDLSSKKTTFIRSNEDEYTTSNPIFSPDGKYLLWLERPVGGPHRSCVRLVKKATPLTLEGEPSIVVDYVQDSILLKGGTPFFGLYNATFIKRCWASDNRLLVSTNQRHTINTYVIDIESGQITELPHNDGSQVVLDVHQDVVLVSRRNYLRQDQLWLARLPAKGQEATVLFQPVSESHAIEHYTNLGYEYSYLPLDHHSGDAVNTFSATYLGPSGGANQSVPLIVWPHGGPHAAFANNAALEISLLTAYKFALLFVNYRGSLGAGQASINFLLGKVGQSDVADCVFATQTALRLFACLDPARVGLTGGSHGGFIVTHLSGQYPDMFQAVVARNPVTDIATMSVISDIPDWAYVEAGAKFGAQSRNDDDLLLKMRHASPIMHAHKVTAPTMLQIGSKDRRVPCGPTMDYFYRLKENKVRVHMNLYEDNHSIATVPHEMDNLINSLQWFREHLMEEEEIVGGDGLH